MHFPGIVIVLLCACGSSIGLPRVFRYNAVLSFHQLVENSDESFLLDNDSWLKFAPNNLVHSGLQNHSWWYQTTWSPQISRIQSLTILIPETNWQTYRMKCLLKALKLWSVDLGPKNPFKSISRISYSHLSYSQVVWVWHQRSNLNMNGAQQILVAWLLDHTQCYVFKIEFSRIYPLPLDLRIFLIFTKIPVMISFPMVWYWLETLRRKPCTIFASAPWSWQLQPMAIWTIWCQPPWVVWHAACVSPANWIATFERSQWSLTEVIGNKIKLFSYWTSKCWVSRRVEVMHHRSCTKL